MKIVKYIFLLLLLAGIAVTVFVATQEGKYNIKKDKVISVSRQVLYNYINDYKNWENLGLFANADTTAAFTYSGNPVGKGAFMSWAKGDNKGRVQTLNAAANDSISQKAVIDDISSDIKWAFKDTLNSTKISVRLKGSLTFKEKALALLNGGMDNKIESSLEQGLDNLNTFLVKEIQTYKVDVTGIVNKKGTFYLGQSATSSLADVNQKAAATFDRLTAFAKENNIVITGRPFILFKTGISDKENVTYSYCIPIRDEMFTSPGSDYEGGRLLPFDAVKATLKGDYSHMAKVWEATKRHINQKALQENTTGQYVEVYAKGGAQTRRPSGWVTDVYTPIGTPTILPVADSISTTTVAGPIRRPAGSTAAPARRTATSTSTAPARSSASTAARTGTSAARPAPTATSKPAVSTQRASGTTSTTNPANGSTVKPAGTTTKPATSNTKPAATTTTKTAATTTTKPTTSSTFKPATSTTAKPATGTAVKPATNNATTKPSVNTGTTKPSGTTKTTTTKTTTKPSTPVRTGNDDLNPPRAEK
jgi:effector-binding domain-containing protein